MQLQETHSNPIQSTLLDVEIQITNTHKYPNEIFIERLRISSRTQRQKENKKHKKKEEEEEDTERNRIESKQKDTNLEKGGPKTLASILGATQEGFSNKMDRTPLVKTQNLRFWQPK